MLLIINFNACIIKHDITLQKIISKSMYVMPCSDMQSEDYHLQWDITKEKWLELKEQPLPWKICLDPVKIMPLYN
jgi:hypothetical protein